MKWLILSLLLITQLLNAQNSFQKLDDAFKQLSQDSSYTKATISFALRETKTGKLLYAQNKDILLAPASTLKTFTTASAIHFLGEDFRYKTNISFKGIIKNKIAYGELIIRGSGDPSLGSDRYPETKPDLIKKQILIALQKAGIETLKGKISIVSNMFKDNAINSGWLDEDIGNYYGAGIYALNWRENKFEINLIPTETSFKISSNTGGYDNDKDFCIELIHKDGATTEEAFAFVEKNKICKYVIRGVLSNKEKTHNMQLASLQPEIDFKNELITFLKKEIRFELKDTLVQGNEIQLTTILSPPLSKLVYWCNQKSLNLYAEAFCKTLGLKVFKKGSWSFGIAAMLLFANQNKIKTEGTFLKDGSGLVPENKISTSILANLLAMYTKQKWFKLFYESLPSINGLIMKSGYIGGTRAYAGYIKLKDGTDASFSFIVNHYSCTPKEVKLDMFRILDLLK